VWQQERPFVSAVQSWWADNPNYGIGIVCGKVSGNLEMTELEGRAFTAESIQAIGERCDDLGVGDAFAVLLSDEFGYTEITPSGGIHLLYRIGDHEVPGNTKIARRSATAEELVAKPDDKVKVLAETRGEGGYVIVAPTGGTVHSTGRSWEVLSGQLGQIPTITWDARNLIHRAMREILDEMPKEEPRERSVSAPAPRTAGTGVRPGDDFNERADWADIIGPAGWTYSHTGGNTVYWVRPGKDRKDGHSATTGHAGRGALDRLYVMSSATGLPTEEPLSKFFVYAHYNHNGNFAEATKALAAQGYGDRLRPSVTDGHEDWASGLPNTPSNVDSPVKGASPTMTLARPKGVHDYTLTGACVRFLDKNRCCIRYVSEQKMWRVWDGMRWDEDPGGAQVSMAWEALTEQMDAEAQTMTKEGSVYAKAYTAHVKKLRNTGPDNALKIIRSHVTCSANDFDADPRYLNLRNGVYDVVTLQFLPHDPKYMLTKVMGCSYNPDAVAPRAEKFLAELLPDFEQRDYVMRALGYTLTGEADQRSFFLLHGLPGTGKSQFVEMMQDIFGDYGVTAMASAFHKRPPGNDAATPGLHELRGARFVTTSETSQDSQLDDELLKRLTGKDRMKTRSLYEKQQEWEPQCTIWLATNHLPKFASDEDAVWKRVKTLPFVTQFSDDGSVGQLSEPNIGRKIAAVEADGIFNLLVSALCAFRVAGRLVEPNQVKQAVADHKRDVDPVAQFVGDSIDAGELVKAPGQRCEFNPVYQAYVVYHKENVGPYPLGRRRFADSLRSLLGYERLVKSNTKTYIPDWVKQGWIIGGTNITEGGP